MRRSVRSCRLATLRPPMPTTRPTRRRSGLSPRVQGGVPGHLTVGAAPPPKSCLFAPDRLGGGHLGRGHGCSAEAPRVSAGVPKCSTRQAERSPLPSLFRRWPVWPRPGASLRHTRLCERSACWRPLALSRSSEISTPHDDAGSPTTRRDVYLCDLYTVPPRRRQLPWCRGVRMTQGSAGRTRLFRERRIGRCQVAGAGHGASTKAAVAAEIGRDFRRGLALNA